MVAVQKWNGPLAAPHSMEAGKNNECVDVYSVVFYCVCVFPFKACIVVVGSSDYLITCITVLDAVCF